MFSSAANEAGGSDGGDQRRIIAKTMWSLKRHFRLALAFSLISIASAPVMSGQAERVRATTVYAPAWSPDNRFITFEAKLSDKWVVMVIGADGTGVRQLADASVNSHSAHWSPDGTRIAYCSGLNNRYEIWVMKADGSGARRLTFLVYEGPAPREK